MGIGQVQSIIGEKLGLILRTVAKRQCIENIKLEKVNVNKKDLKLVAEGLIDTFKFAGNEAQNLLRRFKDRNQSRWIPVGTAI